MAHTPTTHIDWCVWGKGKQRCCSKLKYRASCDIIGDVQSQRKRRLTACSRTSSLGLISRRTKIGTAFFSITTRVWSLVPLAMLVSAHADSNCRAGLSSRWRNSTNLGTTPASITFWIGGLRSGETSVKKDEGGIKQGSEEKRKVQTDSRGVMPISMC